VIKLSNLKQASNFEVTEWLEKTIPELTAYQKEKIRDNQTIRFSPYKFYKRREKINSFPLRLTIIFIPIVYTILLIGLPFKFIIDGKWGYNKIEWFSKWVNACGL